MEASYQPDEKEGIDKEGMRISGLWFGDGWNMVRILILLIVVLC